MSQDGDRFLDFEKSAEKLLDSIEKLNQEASAYKECKDLTDKVGDKLNILIDSTRGIINGIESTISTMKTIGGSEIISELKAGFREYDQKLVEITTVMKWELGEFDRKSSEMNLKLNQLSKENEKRNHQMSDIAMRLTQLSNDMANENAESKKQFNGVKIYLILLSLLAISSLAINILPHIR